MGSDKKITDKVVDTTLTRDEVEFQAYQNQEKLNEYQEAHGKTTLSRRDLMASGVISFAGTLMSQSLFSLFLPQVAQAGTVCSSGATGEWIPLISIHLSGGSNLSSHFLPLDQGGNLLPRYSKMGWGNSGSFAVDKEFANNAPFFGGSTMLTGIRTAASLQALKSSAFVGISATSQDDSAGNAFNISGLARGMGLNGKLIGNMLAPNGGNGSGNQPAFLPPPAPLVIRAYEDLTGALGVGGSLQPLVAAKRAGTMFQTMQQLSTYQAQKYASMNGGLALQDTISCVTTDNTTLIANPGANNTDPRMNTAVAQIWALTNNTSTSARDYVFSSLVYNALNGNGGSANLVMGGYDYHDNTRTSGDGKDQDAGVTIGRIIQTAYALGKKAFITITTDGATTAADSAVPGAPWTSDGGVRGASYVIAVDPAGAPTANDFRIGYVNTDEGAADPFMSSPDRAAAAAFVNWLSFNKKLGDIDKVLPRTFSDADIQKMTKIT